MTYIKYLKARASPIDDRSWLHRFTPRILPKPFLNFDGSPFSHFFNRISRHNNIIVAITIVYLKSHVSVSFLIYVLGAWAAASLPPMAPWVSSLPFISSKPRGPSLYSVIA